MTKLVDDWSGEWKGELVDLTTIDKEKRGYYEKW